MFSAKTILFFFSIVFFLGSTPTKVLPPTGKEFILNVLDSIKKIKTLKYDLKSTERTNGKIASSLSHIKINTYPHKIYFKSLVKNIEVLWASGERGGNALIKPNAFPYVNLQLNPFGSTMRNNQHHTIFELGYAYYAEIVKNWVLHMGNNCESYIKIGADVKQNNHDCYSLTIDYTDFSYSDYTVKKGENLVNIARSRYLCEFLLLEKNTATVKNYYDVKEGQKIKISNAYAKKLELYIDKKTFLPINIKISDEKGLFEQYEYFNIHVNKNFAADEFSKDFKDYGF